MERSQLLMLCFSHKGSEELVATAPRGPGPRLNLLLAHRVGGCGVMNSGAGSGCVAGRVGSGVGRQAGWVLFIGSWATPHVETPAGAEEEQSEEDEEGSELEELKEEEEELEGSDDEDEMAEDDEEDEEELEDKGGNGVEDKFLKTKHLEEFLEQAEQEEYGGGAKRGEKKAKNNWMEEDGDDDYDEGMEDDEDDEEDENKDPLDLEDFEDDEEDEGKTGGDIMYKDFFFEKGSKQVKRRDSSMKKVQFKAEEHENDLDDSENDDDNEQDEQGLSTYEKERLKKRAEIEQMEKAVLEPSTWTMQGEVTASRRPKNSALEVDLDFEHNGHYDDVEKPDLLPTKAPKEHKEMDESKSKKGLAELYEANALFKRICLKLDALSHFHFAPKPVIEDMSIQTNVPALAMEEIATVAVSDAAMLAPEEIFDGKGDIKEDAELTQAERKRRRANKKRKYAESHKERPTKLQKDA
ncbi:hypothetical protein QOZ80_UnG0725130 [Eleusine coracana subsp. coracana]|uniref:Uncharacterized protein n=1 Tax=Eleusine coracana subsp. coracana TaxID=191504 RepID=A0AAV9G3H9_ELECO|nr:hypothetical protein QOZ80_UnG0725130 [Eleusine coracana subsp. coracana]